MIEIIFQSSTDARNFYEHLFEQLQSFCQCDNNILHFEDQHIVRVSAENSGNVLNTVKTAFFQFIVNQKQDDWFKRILMEHYYYDDEGEQQQILEIIHSILEGSREDLAAFVSGLDVKESLKNAIDQLFQNNISFSFDSFVKFRMRPLMNEMTKYVEVSIDEYKMEQEYQMFIHTLRDFLSGKQPKMNTIHVLMDEGVYFYDDQLCEIKRGELIRMIDRKLLSNHPVYVDSVTIAPLLSIAPSAIYLYSDDFDQPLVRTIRNIFEERLQLSPLAAFYHYQNVHSYADDEKCKRYP
ncbi:sporulation protein [Cytobacillus firmus]|uniref:putative sporulation protein YtxC n=1 Tax=Cytobacillus firmus TaxID=1399 RepID=UPI0018CD9268|nr:putative sporulation protein YtxC [Cytobacillus firmus]MBG9445798.1 sporulation protein [Cytobacillus firmus]MBG9448416.1 sporulation protein [Cytobacillus firmus]URT70034.1 putative sporulation protein YtxC [Cytobacillus firmus]WHY60938.1 putative sporulation protein YtxC [Cytobacillus firmus]